MGAFQVVVSSASEPADIAELEPDQLVEQFEDFVRAIAYDLEQRLKIRVSLDDLVAYGYQGLLEAHERFDATAGNRFSSYAYYRVRGAILDGCRKEGWQTRTRDVNRERKMGEFLETTHKVNENIPEANNFKDAVHRVSNFVGDAATVLLLNEMEDVDPEHYSEEPQQEDGLEVRDIERLLKEGLRLLSNEERDIVIRFYFKNENMSDIGESHGHSKSWVSRIHTRAIERIREHFESETS